MKTAKTEKTAFTDTTAEAETTATTETTKSQNTTVQFPQETKSCPFYNRQNPTATVLL